MKHTFSADGQSAWIDIRNGDNRTQKLPSIAGSGTFGGGTLKMEISFEDDKSNPFLYGTGLTANGVESLDIAGAKWIRLDLSGAITPTIAAYINF